MEHLKEPSMDNAFLKKLTDIVLQNLDNEQFGVEDLSEQVGMSRSHLHRKLKLLKGKSISQFIREVRLEEAMKLLRNDVATISEIAYRVGFSSPAYFHRCFHAHYGFPPGETKQIFHDKENTQQAEVNTVSQHVELGMVDGFSKLHPNKEINSDAKPFPISSPKTFIYKIVAACVLMLFIGFTVSYFLKKDNVPSSVEKSIAVLPFDNLSADEENQYFADGIVEDLLNRLSRIEGFKVISRTSSEMYREKGTKSVPQIAQELGVSYIIEGSVQREANKARINVQLIDAQHDDHIWSKLFDRDLKDIFKTQSEIAIQIASELNTVLTTQQTTDLQKNRTDNVKAFELYQLGRFHWNKRTDDGYHTSIDYFEQAIAEDPAYGLAYAGLADTYNLMALQGWIEEKKGRDKAVELALKALALDGSLAEAHNVLASIYTYVDWDWEAAEMEYLRAIEINPNYSTVHHYYSEHLSITGRHEEARKHINKALELDPLSFIIRYVSAKLYYNRGLFTEALADNQRCHELNPDHYWSTWNDFEINYQLGNESEALQGFKHFGLISGEFEPEKADSVFEISGLEGLLRWSIELANWTYIKAEGYGLLGEDDKAMDLLELAFDEGDINPEFTFKYAFKNLHSNPRYIAILKKMGLPPAESSSY